MPDQHAIPSTPNLTENGATPPHHAPTVPDPDALMTFDEGRALLCIGERLAWSLVNCGKLPHLRIGRLIRFRRSSLVQWIEEQERKAGRR